MAFREAEFVFAQSSGRTAGIHPDITGTLSGLQSFDRALMALESEIKRKTIVKAMRRAQKPFKDGIKRNTAKGPTGSLRRAATTSVRVNKNTGFIHSWTGYRRRGKRGAPHAHLGEWGTGQRVWRGFAVGGRPVKAGSIIFRARRAQWSVGRMPAALVQTRLWDKHKGEPVGVFRKHIREAIIKIARKRRGLT